MPVSLNLLGEHVTDAASAEAIFDQYVAAVDAIASAGVDGNISIKLTQLGLGFDDDLCASLLDRLAAHAAAAGTTVTIDMEDSTRPTCTLSFAAICQMTAWLTS